jgi:hypothetical protein
MDIEQPDIQQQLCARAMKDEAFRQEVLENPNAVLQREFGIELPADVTITVHENTASTIHLVLPIMPRMGAVQELSDEELGHIVGGSDPQRGLNAAEYANHELLM